MISGFAASWQKLLQTAPVDFMLNLSLGSTTILVIAAAVFALYMYLTWHFGIFRKLGIKGPRPWPFIGTMYPMMKRGIVAHDTEMRNYGTVVGVFQGRTPAMMIFDVDILKQIMIKEFSHFTNRFAPPLHVRVIRKILTVLKDEHWKHVRNVLTPTFSSGKLRRMNGHISTCADTLMANLQKKADANESFDFRELCGAYTMDVIASTAFGLKIDSHNDPNNQFVRMGRKAFMFSFTSPRFLLFLFLPFLAGLLGKVGISFFPRDVTEFFTDVISTAMSERESDGKNRVDFLQLMMNAHGEKLVSTEASTENTTHGTDSKLTEQKSEQGLTHEEILAQGLLFFLAGFETTANTLSLLAYSLATNPHCQDKLLREIDELTKDHDRVTYDVVHGMPYLEMCLNETLRLYPAGPRTDRVAAVDITINGLFIPKDMMIMSPIYALHMDPDVWQEPDKFIPERFSREASEARNPNYFMPFGIGPRNCVGMRLALTQLKISAVTILQRMKFVTCPETQIPIVLDKVAMKSKTGIWLRLDKRQK